MPRTGKGGGNAPNRDLRDTGTASAGGRTFGEPSVEGARPLQQQPTPEGPGGAPGPTPGPGAQQPMPGPAPGDLNGLMGGTMRADEPITSGIDSGPGPGSDALASSPRRRGGSVLIDIAEESGDPFLMELAERARGRLA